MLESHAPEQMELWHVLGLFSEDPIERQHNIINRSNRALACPRSFERRSRTQHRNESKESNPEVQRSMAEVQLDTQRNAGQRTSEEGKKRMNSERMRGLTLCNYPRLLLQVQVQVQV
mmetsp:Transcript_21201/g.47975  ORF Transcript_21201/g.47975 Transcript_21201/m.47975 type:complete len:117 (+) Transcript_21201:775-1125(+)